MRKFAAIMTAACLFGLASPADAVVQLSISGTLQVNKQTVMCGTGPSAAACLATYPTGSESEVYTQDFVHLLFLPFPVKEGDNEFTDGALRFKGAWTGIITSTNGVLTGKGLSYSYMSSAFPVLGTTTIFGQTRSFSVAAVPEPDTWALMLLGFGAVGTALRRAPRRTLQPA